MRKPETNSYDTSPQSLREVNVLMNIGQSIIRTLEYEEILQIISDGMAELLDIESAAIYLLQNSSDLYLGATTPALDSEMPDFLRKALLEDHPFILKTVQTRKPFVVEDTRKVELSPAERTIIEFRNLRSLLYFPFIQKENVLGVLILGTCNLVKKYSDHQINLGQTVANQLSISIHNAVLIDDLKKHTDHLEELVQEKTKDLDTAIEELQAANDDLYEKNEIINNQNEELQTTLHHLKDTQSQLVQSEKMASLGTLTAGVAHEINNPLNFLSGACIGLVNFFEDNDLTANNDVKILMDALQTGVDRISTIVQGLNQFSRYNSDLKEDCDIASILDNCLVMLNNQIKGKAEVIKEYSCDFRVKGNVGKLHQVFMNLLLNSFQAINDHGQIKIKVFPEKEKNIVVEIADNGIGIDKSVIHKITDPFFTTKAPGQGTGLGLSISYSIVKEHHGQLIFVSEPNYGTTVKVILPINQN